MKGKKYRVPCTLHKLNWLESHVQVSICITFAKKCGNYIIIIRKNRNKKPWKYWIVDYIEVPYETSRLVETGIVSYMSSVHSYVI